MQKTILVTGSTDGIGLATAKMLASQGMLCCCIGRNPHKLADAQRRCALPGAGPIESHVADLSRIEEVEVLAAAAGERHGKLDVLINNAGILRTSDAVTRDGLDVGFVVNTVAPICSRSGSCRFWGRSGRVVNLSSAAQSPVDPEALAGRVRLADCGDLRSKQARAHDVVAPARADARSCGPLIVAVNPGSDARQQDGEGGLPGVDGGDIGIGADILVRAAFVR